MMDQPMYTPCAEWAEKLAATHLYDLSPSDRAALDMHIASCPACATVRAEYQAIDALILDSSGVEPLPDLPIRLLHPRKMLVRLNGSFAPVPMSSLAALTVGETASDEVDREVSLPALPEQDSLQSFFADEGDIELPSPIPPERSFSQTQSPVENAADMELSSPVPALSGLPGMMSLSELADHCMSEINNYRRGEAYNDQYCLELFRRAMLERDDSAWALLVERFHEYMLGSFRRHVRREAASRIDSPENYVAGAFERFWLAAVHNQQLEFTTLAAALSYLRNCLNGAILDTLRAYSRSKGVSLPEPGFADEPAVEDHEEGQETWDIIQNLCSNERERRVAYLLFRCNLKPREIVRRCPQDFSDVQEIYRLRRNIIERLMRDSDQIRWKIAPEPDFAEEPAMEKHDNSQELREIIQNLPATESSAREAKGNFFTRSEVMNSLLPGSMIKERYRLIDELESGSFGTVYIARDIHSNYLYAAKIMHPEHTCDSSLISRFQREAYILQGLSDSHIVRIIDYGNGGDVYYIIMEYVDGQSLKHYITTSGRIEPLRALNYTKQIAEGLEIAHKHGVVHRDIKPQNILINNVGVVKITDFGMARGEDSTTITRPEDFMGTPYYIAPEQVDSGHLADTRSDLYSLAIVLFEMLTGRPPFEGGSIIDIVVKHKKDRVPSICRIRPNLPADMDAFFQKALAKTPAARYQTPREFITALEQLQKQIQAAVSPPHLKAPIKQGYLIVISTGQSIPLTWELMLVGRQDPKVGIFPEINLADMKVGRRHAYLRNRQGTFTVEDLNSVNKTRLNGVTLAPNQEYPLKDGDILRFGSVEVRFEPH